MAKPQTPLHELTPLAERMRPQTLDEFAGQELLLGPGKMLRSVMQSGAIPSLILWGPPGTGKTTLARILAHATSAHFVHFSAVLSGVKEVRQIVDKAQELLNSENKATIFFIDEIHRFNKSQQDAFLPHVESGLFTLIGATTENPSFHVTAPLLSRCRVLVLQSLGREDLQAIFLRALADPEKGLGAYHLHFTEDSLDQLISLADGDARMGLNILEIAATIALSRKANEADQETPTISSSDIEEAGQHKSLRYDKDGEEHYNLISALHKSLRDSDPDGALYWLYRMLDAGEEPLYLCRRLIRFASEDIGLADPQALSQAIVCQQAFQTLGLPEGTLALAQAVTYLATAPKSNSLYTAELGVRHHIARTGSLPVPLHLRNAPTTLMKKLGYGKGYQYAHDQAQGLVEQNHLPPELTGTFFYSPTARGYEALIKDRLNKWRQILQQRKQDHETAKK
ncbi:MAG: replication-associated recombination protein A [Desulfobulbaceae bacterium]|nr:replication-associated recombination protein A [Desulfobulbaceae bacterium]